MPIPSPAKLAGSGPARNLPRRKVAHGKLRADIVINELGFSARQHYLTRHFFQDKITALLLGANVAPEDLMDYNLGHAFDEVADYGSSELFAKVAFDIAFENDLLGVSAHLDSTTMCVTVEYEKVEEDDDDETSTIHLTHGLSKNHRPDPKQTVKCEGIQEANQSRWRVSMGGRLGTLLEG
jgi:transposase